MRFWHLWKTLWKAVVTPSFNLSCVPRELWMMFDKHFRADTVITKFWDDNLTFVLKGVYMCFSGWTILTKALGERMGHSEMTCPLLAQYKHRPWVSRRCRSDSGIRVESSCMGSGHGEGSSGGRHGAKVERWHASIQFSIQIALWMKPSSPMVS